MPATSSYVHYKTSHSTIIRNDRVLRQAVERNFEIIGKALNRDMRSDPNTLSLVHDAPVIIAFRNRLIHGYDDIDNSAVWAIVQGPLRLLVNDLTQLIDQGEQDA